MTYRDLKNIIEGLKRVGKEMTGLDVKVGETFDPGPEFAYSAFKYERHPEIAKGDVYKRQGNDMYFFRLYEKRCQKSTRRVCAPVSYTHLSR